MTFDENDQQEFSAHSLDTPPPPARDADALLQFRILAWSDL